MEKRPLMGIPVTLIQLQNGIIYFYTAIIQLKSISKEEHRCSPNVSLHILQKFMLSVKILSFEKVNFTRRFLSSGQNSTACPGG